MKNWLTGKDPDAGKVKTRGEGEYRGWDCWVASLTWWTWVWASSSVGDGQGSLASCSRWGHKESGTTEWLKWTKLINFLIFERNAQHMLNVYLKFIFKKVPNYFPEWPFSSVQLVMSAPGPWRKKHSSHRRLACGCPGVSGEGVGWWWPAVGLGAWAVAVHAWDLLREVTIIFIQFSSVQLLSPV